MPPPHVAMKGDHLHLNNCVKLQLMCQETTKMKIYNKKFHKVVVWDTVEIHFLKFLLIFCAQKPTCFKLPLWTK